MRHGDRAPALHPAWCRLRWSRRRVGCAGVGVCWEGEVAREGKLELFMKVQGKLCTLVNGRSAERSWQGSFV